MSQAHETGRREREQARPPTTGRTGEPGDRPRSVVRRKRLLFCSNHCVADSSSGAAISLADLLSLLRPRGWDARALCGPQTDFHDAPPAARLLNAHGATVGSARCEVGPAPFSLHHARFRGMRLDVVEPDDATRPPTFAGGFALLRVLEHLLEREPPDLLLTYGGHWIGRAIVAAAKSRGIPVVFWLRNCLYHDAELFAPVDAIIVPGESTRAFYARTLGLACEALPSPIDWERARCTSVEPTYLTFVNPQPSKGLWVFARISLELARARPDIRLLVVEGRSGGAWLREVGLSASDLPNVSVMTHATDPRAFWSVTRAALVPSLWAESFARVPAEAMLNGIPVLASRRGGLSENLAEAGFLFDVPERYTADTNVLPTPPEVDGWVRTIIRLWDDPAFYDAERARALNAARRWHPASLGARYDELLTDIAGHAAAGEADGGESILDLVVPYLGASAARAGNLGAQAIDALLAAVIQAPASTEEAHGAPAVAAVAAPQILSLNERFATLA